MKIRLFAFAISWFCLAWLLYEGFSKLIPLFINSPYKAGISLIFAFATNGLLYQYVILPWINKEPNQSLISSPTTYAGIKHSGTLAEEDGLPAGFSITYSGAWQQPTVTIKDKNTSSNIIISDAFNKLLYAQMPQYFKFKFTIVDFGNGKIVISDTGLITKYNLKEIKVLVKNNEEVKASIGY